MREEPVNAAARPRVALVTGAAQGIGAETARRLASQGHRLALVDLDGPALERMAAALPGEAAPWRAVLDVRDPAAVREMAEEIPARLGPVEILVNNVGGNTEAIPVEEIPPSTFADVMRLNLDPVFLCTRAFVPSMKARRWGRIVNLASIAGRTRTLFSNAAYAAAKAAVIGFTRQCAAELAPAGIAVNAVAHGPIATERILRAWEAKTEERKAAILGAIPAGRMGSIAEAAEAVCFFCGEGAGYAAGSVLDVNGGLFIA